MGTNMLSWVKCSLFITKLILGSCFILLITSVNAQQNHPDPTYRLMKGANYVQSKNYYLVTLFEELADVKALLANDPTLAALGKVKSDSLSLALRNCGKNGTCFIEHLKFSDSEISVVSDRLTALYSKGNPLEKLTRNHLVPSGTYVLYQDLPGAQLLVKAWQQEAAAINWAIDVYGAGKKPNYPLIDSISFHVYDSVKNTFKPAYLGLLYNAAAVVSDETNAGPAFYTIPLRAALLFLQMNERDQVAAYEPMEKGENKPAYDRIKTINWNNYKYSVILLPGAGPDEPGVELSAEGMLRCRLGALQYKKGLAPFIIPSGGCVHPYKTKYNEAIEMKKYLVETLGIPANAVIIEPHARHTTTNMRNAARIMYRYGIPFTKPGITCTTRGQSMMIGSTLIERCQKELNEVPYKYGDRLSEALIEFYPLVVALQLDMDEPMDP